MYLHLGCVHRVGVHHPLQPPGGSGRQRHVRHPAEVQIYKIYNCS